MLNTLLERDHDHYRIEYRSMVHCADMRRHIGVRTNHTQPDHDQIIEQRKFIDQNVPSQIFNNVYISRLVICTIRGAIAVWPCAGIVAHRTMTLSYGLVWATSRIPESKCSYELLRVSVCKYLFGWDNTWWKVERSNGDHAQPQHVNKRSRTDWTHSPKHLHGPMYSEGSQDKWI